MAKFQLYQDLKGEYRWRLVANNGRTIADGSEGYSNKQGATESIKRLKKTLAEATTVNIEVEEKTNDSERNSSV